MEGQQIIKVLEEYFHELCLDNKSNENNYVLWRMNECGKLYDALITYHIMCIEKGDNYEV